MSSEAAAPELLDEAGDLSVDVGVALSRPRARPSPLASAINLEYIARLAAANWTPRKAATALAQHFDQLATNLEALRWRTRVHDQVRTRLQRFDGMPKTMARRLRGKIGERKRWYHLPEEAH